MSAAKCTPGPWKVRKHWCDKDAFEVYPARGRKPKVGQWSAVCEVGWASGGESAKANANLISAAPELLEALERLLASGDVRDSADAGAMKQARAAIAKATGSAS